MKPPNCERANCMTTWSLKSYLTWCGYPDRAVRMGILDEDLKKLEAECIDYIHLEEEYISRINVQGSLFSEYLKQEFKLSTVGSIRIARDMRRRYFLRY